jgi:hypothetical protein
VRNFLGNLYWKGPGKEQTTLTTTIKHKSGQEIQLYGVSAAQEGEQGQIFLQTK